MSLLKRSAPALIMFDIDGTLIRRSGPHHRQALVDAIQRVTGLETTTDHIPVHGMLDPDIISEMMRRADASSEFIAGAMPAIITEAQSIYLGSCPSLESAVCPGVRELLAGLAEKGAVMALVTGNLTLIGWKKMEQAGLRPYFRFGAFGEMSANRAGLVRFAIEHARSNGWTDGATRAVLIGDAENDIKAAQANGIAVVAVGTGVTPVDELSCLRPDLLLEDLRALKWEMLL